MPQEHVTVATGNFKTKVLKKEYPVTEGLTLGTTKIDGRKYKLEPEKSIVKSNDRVGI